MRSPVKLQWMGWEDEEGWWHMYSRTLHEKHVSKEVGEPFLATELFNLDIYK